jgi:uncharacterized protein (DUF433 family)
MRTGTRRLGRIASGTPCANLFPMQGTIERWQRETFTPAEAAALVQLPSKQVRKELEYSIVTVVSASPPRLPFSALVYFETLRLSGLSWSVEDRARLYRLIVEGLAQTPAPENVEFASVLSLKLGLVAREMEAKLARFHAWKDTLVSNPEIMAGEIVFPRSRLTVRRIGELLEQGESPSVVLEDYPELSPQDLEFSLLFVKAYPRVGRPRAGTQDTER